MRLTRSPVTAMVRSHSHHQARSGAAGRCSPSPVRAVVLERGYWRDCSSTALSLVLLFSIVCNLFIWSLKIVVK